MKRVLLIDDDKNFLNELRELLKVNYEVDATISSKQGLMMCYSTHYDLVVVNYNTNDMEGLMFLELCELFNRGIEIVFTINTFDTEKILNLLNSSAIDCIAKTTSIKVIAKRIEKVIMNINNEYTKLYSEKEKIVIDVDSRVVKKDGKKIELTNKEYLVLKFFIENKSVVLSREKIYEDIWNMDSAYANIRTVDMHILKLRKKMKISSLISERGVGYIWNEKDR